MEDHMTLIRLNKFIADAGITSRRGADELINDGRVSVDQKVVREMGFKVDPAIHQVMVDGETIKASLTKTYLALHKPRGVVSTMYDPEGRPSLSDFISLRKERLFHVGPVLCHEDGGIGDLEITAQSQMLYLHPPGEFA
jgi:23S rRNA pseudouridine2605 synthase